MSEKGYIMPDRWLEIREHIHARWDKLSQHDIDEARRDMDKLVDLLKTVYGFNRSRAEREYHEFRLSLRVMLQPRVDSPVTPFRFPKLSER